MLCIKIEFSKQYIKNKANKINFFIYLFSLKKNLEKNQKERDESGNAANAGPLKGSYADYRAGKLKEWRKLFNVDDHGFFKGGGNLITY